MHFSTISLFKNDIYNSEGAFMVFSKLKYLKSLDLDENPVSIYTLLRI
jgi:hypothetical protein